ncbi:MAG: hypothetical protein Q9227_000648 [Pyrenula ochraceoflavens]
MADVAGLVIGAVTLASLFSTCVELFGYFELGSKCGRDYSLACTKLGLLKARLTRWGLTLNIQVPGYEASDLREHWSAEKDVIGQSLYGISAIFSDTSILIERYRLAPNRRRKLRPLAFRLKDIPSPNLDHHQSSISTWSFLRKRTLWAIHDKARFDDLINDLSFLIENLEKVAYRVQMAPEKKVHPTDAATPGNRPEGILTIYQVKQEATTNQAADSLQTPPTTPPTSVAPPSSYVQDDGRQDPAPEMNPLASALQAITQEIFQRPEIVELKARMQSASQHKIEGRQKNSWNGLGVQGHIGHTNDFYHITKEALQENFDFGVGLQGGVSEGAFANFMVLQQELAKKSGRTLNPKDAFKHDGGSA